jgi:hypothetical protein
MAQNIKELARKIKRGAAAGEMLPLLARSRAEAAAMDFWIPDNLRSLRKSLRQLVDTELKPHDAAIEESGQIPAQALDAAATRQSAMAGSASTCLETVWP